MESTFLGYYCIPNSALNVQCTLYTTLNTVHINTITDQLVVQYISLHISPRKQEPYQFATINVHDIGKLRYLAIYRDISW